MEVEAAGKEGVKGVAVASAGKEGV